MAVFAARARVQGAAGGIEVASSMPEGPRAIAVIAHPHPLYGGTMDNKVVSTLSRAFVDAGHAAFRFNFRGVGTTEGVHDEGRGEVDDMVRVVEHARAAAGATLPLALAGFSFGGAVAVRASDSVDFAQLVLVAPGFRRITAEGMGAAPAPDDPSLGAPGRHTTANTLVIHGDHDETVPLSDSLAWAGAREVAVAVVPGGEHFFHRKLHVLREIVSRWVR
ncbi:MAG TPA: alpha/beta family hydrolase [Usitatibacter sp.]|nr:alpha/beta family hydrolase [Usitatibacter sp.]